MSSVRRQRGVHQRSRFELLPRARSRDQSAPQPRRSAFVFAAPAHEPSNPTEQAASAQTSRSHSKASAPATGQTLWTFQAGHHPGLATTAELPAQDGPTTLLLRNAAGKLVRLDLRTGHTTPATSASTGWCRIAILYRQNVGIIPRGGTTAHHFYATQYLLYPCTATRQPNLPPTRIAPFVAQIGTHWHNLAIWASVGLLEAAPMAH